MAQRIRFGLYIQAESFIIGHGLRHKCYDIAGRMSEMKKYIRAFAAVLIAVNIFAAAAPELYAAPDSGGTDTASDGTQGETDPYQKELEDTYKEKVQTNELEKWAEGPGIYGEAGIVMDAETGAVLYGKNIDQKEYPASITKILTALLALKYADMADEVQITAESLTCLGSGYASIGMKEGNVITMEQALYAMLLASSNEVAYAVADTVAKKQGQDYQWFLDQMNETVKNLGGSNSNFVNANGVQDEQHYTCARDMALIASELFEYPEFLQICQTTSYTIPASATTEEHIFQQKHEMLLQGNTEYYEYAVGGKTGYTTEANNTLVTMADNGKMKLVCVTLKTYPGHVYSDTRALLEYGFNNFQKVNICEQENSKKIKSIPDEACVTLPSEVEFSSLDSKIENMGNSGEALLSYTYKGNPVGEAVVKISEDKSFQNVSEEEKTEKDGLSIWKIILICIFVVIILLIIWIIVAAQCRARQRRRRRRRRRRRQK